MNNKKKIDPEVNKLNEQLKIIDNSLKIKQTKIDNLYGVISSNKEYFESTIKELKQILIEREDEIQMNWKFLETYINHDSIDKELIKRYTSQRIKESDSIKERIEQFKISSTNNLTKIYLPLFTIAHDSLYIETKDSGKILLTKREHLILYKLARNINSEISFQDIFDIDKNFKQAIFLIRKKLALGNTLKKTAPLTAILYRE